MAVQWTEDLATGVTIIDDQHKELFERINRLIDACKSACGKEELDETIVYLERYTHEHFEMEERYMQQYNYPGYKDHKEQHIDFIAKFTELKSLTADPSRALSTMVDINLTLVDWLSKHIRKLDKALGKFLKEHVKE